MCAWKYLVFISLVLFYDSSMANAASAPKWQTGTLLATDISGYGGATKEMQPQSAAIWWTYCISSENQFYSAVSRSNPGRMKLSINKQVKFYVKQNRMTILDPNGKRYILRINSRNGCKSNKSNQIAQK
jgi:hypothetical protein